jgi:NADPH:quinone reductase-like Zn-dependent oxidoreductase
LLSQFVSQTLSSFISSERGADLLVLTELIESGKVIPVIDRTYPLSEVPATIRYVRDGHARGKVIITIHDNALRRT